MQRISAAKRLKIYDQKPTLDIIGEQLFGWPPAPHHSIWIHYIEKLLAREIPNNRLLLIAPPAHGKTNWAGVALPCRYLGEYPDNHILYISSTRALAEKSSVAVRDTIAYSNHWKSFFPQIRPDQSKGWSQRQWFLQRKAVGDKDATFQAGGVLSQGVLGSRADLIIFDDVSTKENTRTAHRREMVKSWIQQVAFSRQTKGALMLGIMTRWHAEDIADYFISEAGFTIIHMTANGYWDDPTHPALADINGDPLWEEQYDKVFLKRMRADQGDWLYGASYQGNPSTPEGAIFREEHFHPLYRPFSDPRAREVLEARGRAIEPPYDAVVNHKGELITLTLKVLVADTASTPGEDSAKASYTVFALWGVGIDRQAYLLDVFRKQVEAADLFDRFLSFWKYHRPDIAVIERRASGIQLIQDLQRKTSIPMQTIVPTASKEERARAQAHVVKGALCIPDPDAGDLTWVEEFLEEHLEFARGSYDDQVDTTSMAAAYLRPFIDWYIEEEDDWRSTLVNQEPRSRQLPYEDGVGALLVDTDEEREVDESGFGVVSSSRFGGLDDWPDR